MPSLRGSLRWAGPAPWGLRTSAQVCWGLSVSVSVSSAYKQSVFTHVTGTLSGQTQTTGVSLSHPHVCRSVRWSEAARTGEVWSGQTVTAWRGPRCLLQQHSALRPLCLRMLVLFSCDRCGDAQTWLEPDLNPAPSLGCWLVATAVSVPGLRLTEKSALVWEVTRALITVSAQVPIHFSVRKAAGCSRGVAAPSCPRSLQARPAP